MPAKESTRILISGGLALGGPQTHILLLCRVLREAGVEVTVASAATNWPPEALAALRAMGVRIVCSPFGFDGLKAKIGKLATLLSWPLRMRRDHDVIYCLGAGGMHLFAKLFVRPDGWRIFHEIVDCPFPGSFSARVIERMDGLIANSLQVRDDLHARWPRVPVRIVPFLTSAGRVPAPLERRTRPHSHVLRVAFFGRLVAHKRPDKLLESWPEWNRIAPLAPARLDIYGMDYDRAMIGPMRARIAAANLEGVVTLHGAYSTDDLPKILERTDLVVLPSLSEGVPLVLVEAMQRGVPVVATPAGGTAELGLENPDIIVTNGTGWDEFAAAVQTMAGKVRAGEIDPRRLHRWTEERYGHEPVAARWKQALLDPGAFFTSSSHAD